MTGDRTLDFLRVALGDVREARPQLGSARRLARALEALGLRFEQVGELAVLRLAREQVRDRIDRRLVARALLEVRLQRVEPAAAFLDEADELRQLEAELELALRLGLEAQLDLAQ